MTLSMQKAMDARRNAMNLNADAEDETEGASEDDWKDK